MTTGPRPEDTVQESLVPTRTDHLRFLSAVTGNEVGAIDEHALTASFLPFAMPTWRMVGARDLPSDGASQEATPGIGDRGEGVMGMGQELTVHWLPDRESRLHRTSRVVADVEKTGRSGRFRLLTLQRDTMAGQMLVATQQEFFALRERP